MQSWTLNSNRLCLTIMQKLSCERELKYSSVWCQLPWYGCLCLEYLNGFVYQGLSNSKGFVWKKQHPRVSQILRSPQNKNKYAYCCQNMSFNTICQKIACQKRTPSLIQSNEKIQTRTHEAECQRLCVCLFKAGMLCHFKPLWIRKQHII